MKKVLNFDHKNIEYLDDRRQINIKYWLRFEYFIEQVVLVLHHNPNADSLIQNLKIYSDSKAFGMQRIEAKKLKFSEQKMLRVVLSCSVFGSKLHVRVSTSGHKSKRTSETEFDSHQNLEELLVNSLHSLEMICYNLEIFQETQYQLDLINHSNRLEQMGKYHEAYELLYHVGLISKHRSKWSQSEQIFVRLLKHYAHDEHKTKLIILNLIDCSEIKTQYFELLIKMEHKHRTALLFKFCNLYIDNIIECIDYDSILNCTVVLNILCYVITEVGCSVGQSAPTIVKVIIKMAQNTSLKEKMMSESPQSYHILVGSMELLMQSLCFCAESFSAPYLNAVLALVLQSIHLASIGDIRKSLLQMASYYIRYCSGHIPLDFEQWFRIVYYIEGAQLTDHLEMHLTDLHTSTDSLQQFTHFYNELKRYMGSLQLANLLELIDWVGRYLVEISLSQHINFVLLHHLLDLVNIFIEYVQNHHQCRSRFANTLSTILNPFRVLIHKILEIVLEPAQVFQKMWLLLVSFIEALQPEIEDTVLNVLVSVLNKVYHRKQINSHQMPLVATIMQSLKASNLNQFPDFFANVFVKTIKMLPNSIYTDSIYTILTSSIQFCKSIVQRVENMDIAIDCLVDPYTDYDQKWKEFVQQLGRSIIELNPEAIRHIIAVLCKTQAPVNPKHSHQQRKFADQTQMKKLMILSTYFELGRKSNIGCQQSALQWELNQLLTYIHECDVKKFNLYFQKYSLIYTFMTSCHIQPNSNYFSLMQLDFPPVVYGCMILTAQSRFEIGHTRYADIVSILAPQLDSPWKNLEQLALALTAFFMTPLNANLAATLQLLLKSPETTKKMTALSIIYRLCDQHNYKVMAALIQEITPALAQSNQSNIIKQLEVVFMFVINALRQYFYEQPKELDIDIDDQNKIKQALDVNVRITRILDRQQKKQIEQNLKFEFNLPRKSERERSNDDDNLYEQIPKLPTPTKKKSKQQEKKSEIPQIHINFNTPPNRDKDKTKLYTTPRERKEHRPLKAQKANSKVNSPVVEIESINSQKFQISLTQIKEKWRQNLDMIHKKKSRKRT